MTEKKPTLSDRVAELEKLEKQRNCEHFWIELIFSEQGFTCVVKCRQCGKQFTIKKNERIKTSRNASINDVLKAFHTVILK